jgi:hypothetical protein
MLIIRGFPALRVMLDSAGNSFIQIIHESALIPQPILSHSVHACLDMDIGVPGELKCVNLETISVVCFNIHTIILLVIQ